MSCTKEIMEILLLLKNLNNKKINRYLKINKEKTKIKLKNSTLCEINSNSIILGDKINILNKITINSNNNQNLKSSKFSKFINTISDSIIRLNHVGVAYFCTDIKKEIIYYKKLLKDSNIKIYEEDSGNKKERWLFAGNLEDDWQSPLFEVVLLENSLVGGKFENKLSPHFQIDLDTDFSFEELNKFVIKYFGEKFIDWYLDLPNGRVLIMGSLASIHGIKIRLGLATKLRDTKFHRKNILKEI